MKIQDTQKEPRDRILQSIEAFSSLISFSELISNSEWEKDKETKIVHVAGLNYQVLSEDNPDSLFAKDATVTERDQNITVANFLEEKPKNESNEPSQAPSQNLHIESAPSIEQSLKFHPGFLIRLLPLDTKAFMESLPKTLRSFIQESVKIIKEQNLELDSTYLFKFEKLNLELQFEKAGNQLKLQIVSSDKKLLKDLEENQKELLLAIQKQFDEEIEVTITESESSQFVEARGQEHGGGQNQNQNQNQENTNREEETL